MEDSNYTPHSLQSPVVFVGGVVARISLPTEKEHAPQSGALFSVERRNDQANAWHLLVLLQCRIALCKKGGARSATAATHVITLLSHRWRVLAFLFAPPGAKRAPFRAKQKAPRRMPFVLAEKERFEFVCRRPIRLICLRKHTKWAKLGNFSRFLKPQLSCIQIS